LKSAISPLPCPSLCLRVCPESLGWITEFSEHEADGSEAQESERLAIAIFPILGEPAAAIEPSDSAFDDPSFGDDLEADCIIGSLDDFNVEVREAFCDRVGELRSLIAAVSKQFVQERKHPEQRRHHENATIAILDVGWMDDGVQQQA
jgi:hypothetical protein